MSEYYAIQRSTGHLAHYGVKGMKWGVRRNKDSLTSEKKREQKQYYKAFKNLGKSVYHDPVKNYEHSFYKRGFDMLPDQTKEKLINSAVKRDKIYRTTKVKSKRDRIDKKHYDEVQNALNDLLGKKYTKKLGYATMYKTFSFGAGDKADEAERRNKKYR